MEIRQRLDSIEAKRTHLIDLVSGMEPALVAAHPRPGKWSILEIVEHLVLAEVGVLGELNALGQLTPLRRRPKDRVRYQIVMFILRFDIPVQVPSRAMVPKGTRSLEELRAAWEAGHHQLRLWILDSGSALRGRPLFLHPVAGPMTTVESLRMLEVHLDRHTRQVKALAKVLAVDTLA